MKNTLLAITVLIFTCTATAQDFMLQGWYWDYPKTCDGHNWANTLQAQVNQLSQAGITHVWLPPLSRASFGSCSNGYDPKDLYDLGEYGLGATGFGTRTNVDALISALSAQGIEPVADVVYNHRDGGAAEDNSAVKAYIEQYMSTGKTPFPSDRFRCYIPLGGSSPYGAGHYYFKVSSKTGNFGASHRYKFYANTAGNPNTTFLGTVDEVEPNGGGDCCQSNNDIQLHQDMQAYLGTNGNDCGSSGCGTDEFHLELTTTQYNTAGDRLTIYLTNIAGGYSDHRIYSIWYDPDGNGPVAGFNVDLANYLKYETYTNFNTLPSGQGGANFENFRPNTSTAPTTFLSGFWDGLWFFYDVDQNEASTRNMYFDWSEWLWDNVGIRGYRMDAVKHFPENFVGDLLDQLHDTGKDPGVVVGEYFDSNPSTLKTWVTNVENNMDADTKSAIKVRAFDFSIREALKKACDQFGYDVRQVFTSGMVDGASASGFNVVTFLNNHDYREEQLPNSFNINAPVQNDPMLGYAYLLTNNQIGMPCIFYPEFFGLPVQNGPNVDLYDEISELIEAHELYIFGKTGRDYLSKIGTTYTGNYTSGFNNTTLFYQLLGPSTSPDVLVAINFAGVPLTVSHTINGTNVPLGAQFGRVAGGASSTSTLTVQNGYFVDFTVPARSYAVWVEGVGVPVELVDFQASVKNNSSVLLEWHTAAEINFDQYELQRSTDGRAFESIATVAARGNNSVYSHLDQTVQLGNTYYYRLKIKDLDGSFEYSPARQVALGNAGWGRAMLVPNPTDSGVSLHFQAPQAGPAVLTIFNAVGQRVSTLEVALTEDSNIIKLEASQLPTGIYFLECAVDGVVRWRERGVRR